MNILSRISNTFIWWFKIAELAEKVLQAEEDITEFRREINANRLEDWREVDKRLDKIRSDINIRLQTMANDLSYIKGNLDEINRQNHSISNLALNKSLQETIK